MSVIERKINEVFKEVTEPKEGMLYRAPSGEFYKMAPFKVDSDCICKHGSGCQVVDGGLFGKAPWAHAWVLVPNESKPEAPKPAEKLDTKRHIRLQVIERTGGKVTFKVAEQTHREKEFCANGSEFKASNGMTLSSYSYPEEMDEYEVFLRGDRTKDDEEKVCVTSYVFSRIEEAVEEYNITDGKGYAACGISYPLVPVIPKQTFKKFWMVYLTGGDTPAYRHDSQESAKAEAERLSKKYNKEAFVLDCTHSCKQDVAPIIWKDAE